MHALAGREWQAIHLIVNTITSSEANWVKVEPWCYTCATLPFGGRSTDIWVNELFLIYFSWACFPLENPNKTFCISINDDILKSPVVRIWHYDMYFHESVFCFVDLQNRSTSEPKRAPLYQFHGFIMVIVDESYHDSTNTTMFEHCVERHRQVLFVMVPPF